MKHFLLFLLLILCVGTVLAQTGKIDGYVFNDLNGNGIKDGGESGLPYWQVKRTAPTIDSAYTDSSGYYSFSNLTSGYYYFCLTLQGGWTMTTVRCDSVVSLGAGQTYSRNFGVQSTSQTGSICGTVFSDLNCNGVKDVGDVGLSGWTVSISGASNNSTTTNGSGNFCFTGLAAGTYTLCETQQLGWTQSMPTSPICYSITLGSGQSLTGKDFGNCQMSQGGCPNNKVLNPTFLTGNVPGAMPTGQVSNWTLSYGTPDVTRSGGCEDSGYVSMWGNQSVAAQGEGLQQSMTFTAGKKYSISFCAKWPNNPQRPYSPTYVFRASNGPLSGPTGGTVIGTFHLSIKDTWVSNNQIPAWIADNNYSILTVSVTNQSNANNGDSTTYASIDNICITEDSCRQGIDTIQVLSASLCDTFSCVTLSPDGSTSPTLTSPNSATVGILKIYTGSLTSLNLTLHLPSNLTGSLSGVTTSFGSTSAAWSDTYPATTWNIFNPNVPNTISVAPCETIYVYLGMALCLPDSVNSGNYSGYVNAVVQGKDSIYLPIHVTVRSCVPGSISGTKFLDVNCNGVQDPGDEGLQYWTIFIDANGNHTYDNGEITATTDANGAYIFNGLTTGTYSIYEKQEPGWTQSTPNGGYTIFLSPGQNVTGKDFGNCAPACPVETTCCQTQLPSYPNDTAWTKHFSPNDVVAIATVQQDLPESPMPTGYSSMPVVGILNITNHAAQAHNVNWHPSMYFGKPNEWTSNNLGSVFGVTRDKKGNIYVTKTRVYNSDELGALAGSSGWGTIFKLNTITGTAQVFASLPNSDAVGLGNIAYDCGHDQLFVTNFEDGRIYRLPISGGQETFDPLTPYSGSGPVAEGDRLWGIAVYGNRVYYSVWVENLGGTANRCVGSFVDPLKANEIRSVGLTASGHFDPTTDRHEIWLPPYTNGGNNSNPVSDISFSKTGKMLLSERSVCNWDNSDAHEARLLEYICCNGVWERSTASFTLSLVAPNSASGGNDYLPDGSIISTADAIHYSPNDYIYGAIILPATGGSPTNSQIIDLWGQSTVAPKTQMGDIEVAAYTGNGTSSICGRKWYDINRNGIFEPKKEYGLGGWKIALLSCNRINKQIKDTIAVTITDAFGNYCFTNLCPGCYCVAEVGQYGWAQTWPASPRYYQINLGSNQYSTGNDFGNYWYRIYPDPVDTTVLAAPESVYARLRWPMKIAKLDGGYHVVFNGFFGVGDSLPAFSAGQYSVTRKHVTGYSFGDLYVNDVLADNPAGDSVNVTLSDSGFTNHVTAANSTGFTIQIGVCKVRADSGSYYRTFTAAQFADNSQKTPSKRTNATLPTTANLVDELLRKTGEKTIGLANQFITGTKTMKGYLGLKKQADWFKTLNVSGLTHSGTPRGLDFFDRDDKRITKKQTTMPPTKHNNQFLADLMALKFNIYLSDVGKTPRGFGDLVCNYVGTTPESLSTPSFYSTMHMKGTMKTQNSISDPLRSPFQLINCSDCAACRASGGACVRNGSSCFCYQKLPHGQEYLTIRKLAAFGDTMLTNWEGIASEAFVDVDSFFQQINSAFSKALPITASDTLRWMRGGKDSTQLKGAVYLKDVPWLQQVPDMSLNQLLAETPVHQAVPSEFDLKQNYPNPFNPTTTIAFNLPVDASVTVAIFDVLGRRVAILAEHQQYYAGSHQVVFNANELASGLYFYQMTAEYYQAPNSVQTFTDMKKMMFIK